MRAFVGKINKSSNLPVGSVYLYEIRVAIVKGVTCDTSMDGLWTTNSSVKTKLLTEIAVCTSLFFLSCAQIRPELLFWTLHIPRR